MIIDRDRRYIYIQSPQTGSTLIGKLLINEHGAEKIGRKHDFLWDLSPNLRADLDSYYVFTAVRDPHSQVLSAFAKTQQEGATNRFDAFVYRQYPGPYLDWRSIDHDRCDALLRLDSLADDFVLVKRDLGLRGADELERRNATKDRVDHELDGAWLMYVFGPHRAYLNSRAQTSYDVDWSVLSPFQRWCTQADYRARMWLFRRLNGVGYPPTSTVSRWMDRGFRALARPVHRINTRGVRPSTKRPGLRGER